MVDYQNGKIYKIECTTTGDTYIGSTTKPLDQRLQSHVEDYEKDKSGWKVGYLTSYRVLKNQTYQITLLESVSCDSKTELLAREKHHIVSNNCVNKHIPTRTRAEYRQDNKDKILEYAKEYRLRKYFCECCQIDVLLGKRSRHVGTKKHQANSGTLGSLCRQRLLTEKVPIGW
jgi:Uri superfamily endonuclease